MTATANPTGTCRARSCVLSRDGRDPMLTVSTPVRACPTHLVPLHEVEVYRRGKDGRLKAEEQLHCAVEPRHRVETWVVLDADTGRVLDQSPGTRILGPKEERGGDLEEDAKPEGLGTFPLPRG